MRAFLVFSMLLIASGDDEITINGVLEDSVLLPCSCHNRNLERELKWQMDNPNKILVVKYIEGTSSFSDRYKGRVNVFVEENNSNCSVFLTNIKQEDQGKYRCIFHREERYTTFFVNLNISGKSSELQPESTSGSFAGSLSSQSACFMRHFKTIPVVVVLGLSLMSEIFI